MGRRDKRLRGTFRSKSEKDVAEGLYYEVVGKEVVCSEEHNALHQHLTLFGYPLRTDYGVRRVFPYDGDVFVRNLPQMFSGPYLWVELEEVSVT